MARDKTSDKKLRERNSKGQMIIEYAVMFVVIVAVIIYAATAFVRPALNRFFNSAAKIINTSTEIIENNFPD